MNDDYFMKALNAYEEMEDELSNIDTGIRPTSLHQSMSYWIKEVGVIPPEALTLGIAVDGLPVMLDLYDSTPMSILVRTDNDIMFENIVRTALHMSGIRLKDSYGNRSVRVEYYMLTSKTGLYENILPESNIIYTYSSKSENFLCSLASYTQSKINKVDSTVLFLDDIYSIKDINFDGRQNLAWLLLRGAPRGTWIIARAKSKIDIENGYEEKFKTIIRECSREAYESFPVEKNKLHGISFNNMFMFEEKEQMVPFYCPEDE